MDELRIEQMQIAALQRLVDEQQAQLDEHRHLLAQLVKIGQAQQEQLDRYNEIALRMTRWLQIERDHIPFILKARWN